MARKGSKKIRRIKKTHSWVVILLFLIVQAMAAGLIFGFGSVFLSYFVESKVESEFQSVSYLARLYEISLEDEKQEDVYKLIDESGRDYIIRDVDGNVIHDKGNITVGDTGKIVLSNVSISVAEQYDDPNDPVDSIIMGDERYEIGFDDNTKVYEDTEYDYVYVNDANAIDIRFKKLYNDITKSPISNVEIDENMSKEDVNQLVTSKIAETKESTKGIISLEADSTFHLPYWVAVSVNGGKEEFIGKAYVNFAITDLGFFMIFIILLVLLAFLIFVIMLVFIISNFINQRKTIKLLFTDIVTNGHNWMWFLYRGEHFLRRWGSARSTYAVVNIVFVKYRNYCVCHSIEQGEKMLKRVYDHIGKHLEKKEMIAHVSNSNFALLLKYDDPDKLKMRLQSIILELEKIDPDHVFSFQAGVDLIGVWKNENGRVIRRKGIDLEVEYNNACTARATLADKDESGVAFFDDKLIEDQKWIDKVTERQRYAIEHEEFMVYYQPKYDPSTNKLRGAEALIRWQNDDMGFVPPGRFIPIFEKSGFITEIDHYMLEHVARDQKAWLDKGFECVPVSVNVSRAHFIESDLAEQIRDIVDKAGTPHKYIEIELTESAFFDDKKALIATITRLKEYGFAVSMDDFGSGYSSLNSLKDMPLDVLKLDAEFFQGDSQGDRGEIVVSEAIKLAKSLNMRTVAEGVEVKEQVDFLASQGCDMIQGYYFAKPMPKEDYEQRMKG